MALEMRTECERCGASTPADGVAYVCSYECTYCTGCAAECVSCPNCAGELLPRPRRELSASSPSMTQERLAEFGAAWQRADVPTLMSFVAEDCVYSASIGPEPGTTFTGRAEVERGFRTLLDYERERHVPAAGPDAKGSDRVFGQYGFSQWSYWQADAAGRPVEVRGCDFFEFEGRLIRRKDAFLKTWHTPKDD